MTPLPDYPHDIKPVPHITPDSAAELEAYINNYQPVLVERSAETWPLFQKLSHSPTLGDRIGVTQELLSGARVRYTLLPPEQGGDIGIGEDLRPNFRLDDQETSASDFLAVVAELIREPTGACAYAASLPLENFPGVAELVPQVNEIAGRPLWHRLLWIGSGRHIVDLHHDTMLNFITVLEGVKRITLVAPEALPYVYPAPMHRTAGGAPRSLVKVMNVDWERFPRFKQALPHAQLVTVRPGETLFIPPLWWHYVESYGFNVMVNGWYNDSTGDEKKRLAGAEREFMAAVCRLRKQSMDGEAARAAASQLASVTSSQRPAPNAQHAGSSRIPRAVQQTISAARRSLRGLSEYWQAWYRLQYQYYVFRIYGDPYPTVPGALDDLTRHFRSRGALRFVRKATRLPRRAARYVLRTARSKSE